MPKYGTLSPQTANDTEVVPPAYSDITNRQGFWLQ
jgi:hypothetical protein